MEFEESVYYCHLLKGELCEALCYAEQFPQRLECCRKIRQRFESDCSFNGICNENLSRVLRRYCEYFRDVFYYKIEEKQAEEELRVKLAELFDKEMSTELYVLEEDAAAPLFEANGFHFLGGRTSGYRGPYIWRETESVAFAVELPEGIQTYYINFLDGFVMRSWLDYISFGEIGTGGWTNGDGTINCVKASYDTESEAFKVSLLKHEAQHVQDLQRNPDLSSEILEYRAKLVELIYSKERNLLLAFIKQADDSNSKNGHSKAAFRIIEEFCSFLSVGTVDLSQLEGDIIRSTALQLFEKSSRLLFHT